MSRRCFSSLGPCRQHTQARNSFRQLPRTISHLLDDGNASLDSEVAVSGWVRSIRKQKAVAFVSVNDGSSVDSMQVVVPSVFAQDLTIGSSVSCKGVLQPSPGPNQSLELQASSIRLIGSASTTYPIQKKAQSAEFLRNYPHLRTRTSQGLAMLRLRDKIMQAFCKVYDNNGFVLVQPPILTSNDCEGAGEAFRVTTDAVIEELRHATPFKTGDTLPVYAPVPEFFGRPTYLTVSTQLHLEALAASISRVYTISPVFRAEPSQTHRHISEFSMVEAEMAFCEELEDVMSFVEQSLKAIVSSLRTSAASEISVFQDMQSKYGGHPFEGASGRSGPIHPVDLAELHTSISSEANVWERMTYLEAVKEIESYIALNPGRQVFSHPVGSGLSLQSEHEKWLAGTLVRGPLFVTDYPAALKPFYMRSNGSSNPIDAGSSPREEHRTVSCFDLLVPRVGELVGGSLREERVDLLTDAMEQQNIPRESLQWYLDLRRYGSAPTGGFGLGFERLMSWLTGFENVRDCMPFPRAVGKILL